MKKLPRDVDKFFKWLRAQPCYFGGIRSQENKFPRFCQQDWDQTAGQFKSEVSHIMRKGSTRRNDHFGNVFPNCRIHHQWFENLAPEARRGYLSEGSDYYSKYLTTILK